MTHPGARLPHAADDGPQLSATLTWLWPEALLIVIGSLDDGTASVLERRLDEALEHRSSRIVLDASGLSFVDRGGALVLKRAAAALADRGHELVLVDPPEQLRRLLWGLEAGTALTITASHGP